MKKKVVKKVLVNKKNKKQSKLVQKKQIPIKKSSSKKTNKVSTKNTEPIDYQKNNPQNDSEIKQIEFVVKTNPNLKVFIAGTFNDWNSTSHPLIEKKKGLYKTSINLSKGSYEYKYVINGVWCIDNFKPSIWNDTGSMNNILEVY